MSRCEEQDQISEKLALMAAGKKIGNGMEWYILDSTAFVCVDPTIYIIDLHVGKVASFPLSGRGEYNSRHGGKKRVIW